MPHAQSHSLYIAYKFTTPNWGLLVCIETMSTYELGLRHYLNYSVYGVRHFKHAEKQSYFIVPKQHNTLTYFNTV